MEERPFIDGRVLIPFRGTQSCSACQNFVQVILVQCQVLGAAALAAAGLFLHDDALRYRDCPPPLQQVG